MRFNVNLGLKKQTVSFKVENGRTIVSKMGLSAYFLAPNPLPHPTLANFGSVITALETAYEAAQGGGKLLTQAAKTAETNYDNSIAELSHYVEDRANSDPVNGAPIITAAGMNQKVNSPKTILDFSAKNGEISGQLEVRIKATDNTTYVVQTSPNPANGTAYVWTQAKISQYASLTLSGFTRGSIVWLRYARIVANVQGDFSDPISVVVG